MLLSHHLSTLQPTRQPLQLKTHQGDMQTGSYIYSQSPNVLNRMQGASIMMEQFSKHFDSLQVAILSTEVDDHVGLPCQYQRDAALFCCMDCLFSPILCSTCVITSHTNNPFHCLQKWGSSYFGQTALSDLGHIVGLGHYRTLCPNHLPDSKGCPTTVIHVNGIHHIRILYCQCTNAPSKLEQLCI